MEFPEWDALYRQILREFGFSRERDEAAARLLDALLPLDRMDPEELRSTLEGEVVTVLGNAPSLPEELDLAEGPLIAADEALSVVVASGFRPEVLVTDLDGRVEDQVRANREGTVAVVHAHGDNTDALRQWAPRFTPRTVGTTQATPLPGISNFGGFTDGDRGAFLAAHFGAREILLLGFDFERPNPKDVPAEVKRRKLAWAERLIGLLAQETPVRFPASSS